MKRHVTKQCTRVAKSGVLAKENLSSRPGDCNRSAKEMRIHSLPLDELIARGVSPSFARILCDPDSYHPNLSIHIGTTNWDYFIPADATDIVPLWDSNADSFVRWTRAGTIEYVWLFHDDPKWILIARSEQGVMAELWQQWAEFQESDEECLRFADAIGFRYAEEGLKIIEKDSDTINRWRLELTD